MSHTPSVVIGLLGTRKTWSQSRQNYTTMQNYSVKFVSKNQIIILVLKKPKKKQIVFRNRFTKIKELG